MESVVKPPTGLTQERAGQLSQGRRIQQLLSQAHNRIVSAWTLWFLGYPDRALERLSIAIALTQESGSKRVEAAIRNTAIYIFDLLREPEQMRESAEATMLSTGVGTRAESEISLGWADAVAGDLEGGIARMRRHLSEYRASGTDLQCDYYLAWFATALGRLGRFDEALHAVDESFAIIERGGARYYEAEVHRVKGELLLAQDASNAAQAEQSFRTAIKISRKQRAKSWELRATTSLARLLRDTNRRDEARAMLADIYGWFTEGFDTADLKDSKALLDELGG